MNNVDKEVKRILLNYPMLYPNALTVYNQLFCVIGNGYEWKNGELVYYDKSEIKRNSMSVKTAVMSLLKEELIDEWRDEDSATRRFMKAYEGLDDMANYVARHNEHILEDVKRIFHVNTAMNDFSIPTERLTGIMEIDYQFKFYPLCEYSAICCIPDDVKPDWLIALNRMYIIMKEHIDLVEDDKGWMEKIEKRLKHLNARVNLKNLCAQYAGIY